MSLCKFKNIAGVDVVEEFLKKFIEEDNHCTKAVALISFTRSYLQNSKDNPENAARFSSSICPKVLELFSALTQFDKITYDADKEVKVLNLQSSVLCLETLLVCHKQFDTKDQFLSLLQITLKVLFQAYTHCERSENLYADAFEELTEQLAVFYQNVQDVQNASMAQLEKLMNSDLSHSDVLSISVDLGKLCVLVASLDTMVSTKIWRAYVKFVTQYAALVQDKLEMDPVMASLLGSINSIISENKVKLRIQEKIEDSDVKLLLFFLNLVMKVTHAFKFCLCGSANNLSNLLIELYSLFTICSMEEAEELLRSALVSSIASLTSLFFADDAFLDHILRLFPLAHDDVQLPWLFLSVSAIKQFNSNRGAMSPEENRKIFEGVFKSLQKCKPFEEMLVVNLKFPQALFSRVGADKEQTTTLYDELYKNVSEFAKTIPDSYFSMSEVGILELISSTSDVSSLLFSDVWMHRLRNSSVETIHECCSNLSKDEMKLDSNIYLKMLRRRLLKFLPLENRILFLDNADDQRMPHRYSIPHIFTIPASVDYKALPRLMDDLRKPASKKESQLVQKADCILEMFALLADVAKNEDILKFSEFAKILFKTEVYEIQIAVLTFMKALKCKQLNKSSPNLRDATQSLAGLLTETLKSRNYVVRHEALDTYFAIAQSTQHTEIFQTAQSPQMVPMLKSYAAKIPLSGFLPDKERMWDLKAQLDSPRSKTPTRDSKQVLYQLK